MKKLIFTLTVFFACYIGYAQTTGTGHCGTVSGPGVCTPMVFDTPGFYPTPAGLNPIVTGEDTTFTIFFKNFDTATFDGFSITIQAVVVDTISNLPDGLCWSTDAVDDSFLNQQNGCIVLTGTTTAAPGQYRLNIAVTAYVGLPEGVPENADALGLYYYIRVICPDDTTPHPIDTTGQSQNTNLFIPYAACNVNCTNAGGTAEIVAGSSICPGSTAELWVWNDTGAIQWQQSPDGVTWTNVTTGMGADSDYYTTGPLTANTYYWAELSQPGCSPAYSSTVLVTVLPPPDDTITANGPTTFCQGDSVGLSVPEGNSYLWSNSDENATIYAKTTGTYSVTVTDDNECTASSSIAVTVNTPATAGSIELTVAADSVVCAGQTVEFWAYNYTGSVQWQYSVDNYTWYNVTGGTGADSSYYTTAPLTSTFYYWTAVSKSGCPTVFSNSVLVTVNPLPAVPVITENSSNDTLTASSQGVTYQWYESGESLAGDTSQVLPISTDGIYSVMVDSNGCTNQSAPDSILDVAISSPGALAGMKLYPNPNNGTFILEFTDNVLRNIEIYDALGNVIYSNTGISKTSQINMQNAEAGVYLLCIKQNQQITNLKFVVMK